MKTVYSKLIPTEEYGEFLLSFTCQKCSENNAVVLKITNEEGFAGNCIEYMLSTAHTKELYFLPSFIMI